jgi:hypothetical protein
MKKLLFVSIFFAASYCNAQLPDYYTYLVKGQATVMKPGAKAMLLKQNSFIYKADEIALQNGAEVTLVDKDQNFFVLRSAGIYPAKGLVKTKGAQVPGVTQKYLSLVWNELLNPKQDYANFSNSNVGGVSGGVFRGLACNNLIFPIKGLRTSSDSIHFKWLNTSPGADYMLLIYDHAGKEVLNMQVADTQKTLSLAQSLHSVTGNYYWLVKGRPNGCEEEVPVYFEFMSPGSEQQFIASLPPADTYEGLPGQLRLIDKLEKNLMILAACKCFSSLVNSNRDDKALLKSYVLFLLKYGFNKEASDVWQENVTANNLKK